MERELLSRRPDRKEKNGTTGVEMKKKKKEEEGKKLRNRLEVY